jgi:hypothetical protein
MRKGSNWNDWLMKHLHIIVWFTGSKWMTVS